LRIHHKINDPQDTPPQIAWPIEALTEALIEALIEPSTNAHRSRPIGEPITELSQQ
jgi:hypothetical protein